MAITLACFEHAYFLKVKEQEFQLVPGATLQPQPPESRSNTQSSPGIDTSAAQLTLPAPEETEVRQTNLHLIKSRGE